MSNITDILQAGTYSPAVRRAAGTSDQQEGARRIAHEPRRPEITVRPADTVDISALARRLGLITTGEPASASGVGTTDGTTTDRTAAEPFRTDLVQRIRAEIDGETYETPEKLDAAVERLTRELDVTG